MKQRPVVLRREAVAVATHLDCRQARQEVRLDAERDLNCSDETFIIKRAVSLTVIIGTFRFLALKLHPIS